MNLIQNYPCHPDSRSRSVVFLCVWSDLRPLRCFEMAFAGIDDRRHDGE
jgi:hypothetical protein